MARALLGLEHRMPKMAGGMVLELLLVFVVVWADATAAPGAMMPLADGSGSDDLLCSATFHHACKAESKASSSTRQTETQIFQVCKQALAPRDPTPCHAFVNQLREDGRLFVWAKLLENKGQLEPQQRCSSENAVLLCGVAEVVAATLEESESQDHFLASSKRLVVALSGGGVRSAVLSLTLLEWLVEQGLYEQVGTIAALSGGSWGGALWCLFGSLRAPAGNGRDWLRTGSPYAKVLAMLQQQERGTVGVPLFGKVDKWSRPASLVGTHDTLYDWRDDVHKHVLFGKGQSDMTMQELAHTCRANKHVNLQVMVNAGAAGQKVLIFKERGLSTWETSTSQHPVNKRDWWRDQGQLMLENDAEDEVDLLKQHDLTAWDILALSSSAFTGIGASWYLKIRLGLARGVQGEQSTGQGGSATKNTKTDQDKSDEVFAHVHDAGLDCNNPLNPEWRNDRLVLMMDASFTDEGGDRSDLSRCLRYWRKVHNVAFDLVPLMPPKVIPEEAARALLAENYLADHTWEYDMSVYGPLVKLSRATAAKFVPSFSSSMLAWGNSNIIFVFTAGMKYGSGTTRIADVDMIRTEYPTEVKGIPVAYDSAKMDRLHLSFKNFLKEGKLESILRRTFQSLPVHQSPAAEKPASRTPEQVAKKKFIHQMHTEHVYYR